MLDIKYLRQNVESIKQALLIKGFELDIDTFNSLENNRKLLQVGSGVFASRKKGAFICIWSGKGKG